MKKTIKVEANVGDQVEISWIQEDQSVVLEIRTASPKSKTVMRVTEKM